MWVRRWWLAEVGPRAEPVLAWRVPAGGWLQAARFSGFHLLESRCGLESDVCFFFFFDLNQLLGITIHFTLFQHHLC